MKPACLNYRPSSQSLDPGDRSAHIRAVAVMIYYLAAQDLSTRHLVRLEFLHYGREYHDEVCELFVVV